MVNTVFRTLIHRIRIFCAFVFVCVWARPAAEILAIVADNSAMILYVPFTGKPQAKNLYFTIGINTHIKMTCWLGVKGFK